jgi:hypothetical protein
MGLCLAIKRSYRHLIPSTLLDPRKLVRQIYVPAFFYIIGLSTGMYSYARPGEGDHITRESIVAMVVLLLLVRWPL